MPELPEVETVVRNLRDGHPRNTRSVNPTPDQVSENQASYSTTSILEKTITRAELLWGRTLAEPDEPAFYSRITGQRIKDIQRRAKYLVFHLSEDYLIIHLRMSGDLLVEGQDDPMLPHHRLVLYLDDALRLAFNDTRKFGRVWLVDDPDKVLADLGPEPLAEAFTTEMLYTMLQEKKRQLKPLLLDQSFIAGLGNIYTDEALHRARLHPLRQANTVSPAEADVLWEAIRHVLQEGIRRNGASIDWMYRGGDFQNHFQAYGRTDEPCYTCGSPIRRVLVGQRSTHFCPVCQQE